ncbi:MAG: FkbM family methyltransferase [Gemmatimonadaceae bacterium]
MSEQTQGFLHRLRSSVFHRSWSGFPDAQRDKMSADMGIVSMGRSLRNLARNGFSPRSIVDVGAFVGDWTREAMTAFPGASVLMVEPRPTQEKLLDAVCAESGSRASYAMTALGRVPNSELQFFVTAKGGSGSSAYEEISDVARVATTVPSTTLDELVERRGIEPPQLLKADVQGFELEVLAGATATLAAVEVLILEVAFWPYNKGAPLMTEVLSAVKELGFRPYDVASLMRRPQDDAVVHCDMLFVNQTSPLLRDTETHW